MQLRTLNVDKMIRLYNMKEVTSPFLDGPGTLFDPDIFGERTETQGPLKFGYIKLKGHFIDPALYAVLIRVNKDVLNIVDGTEKYIIKDGYLIKDSEGGTGLDWFYENFDKIKFNKMRDIIESGKNRLQSNLMKKSFLKLKKEDVFIDKIVVLPLRYRDLETDGGKMQLDEINQLYVNLMRAVNNRARLMNNAYLDKTKMDNKIQWLLGEIFEYFKTKVFGKMGAQRKLALSRSIDHSARVIIVAPKINPRDTIGNTKHKLNNAEVPLHHIINTHPIHTETATKRVLVQLFKMGFMNCNSDEFDYTYTNEYIKEEMEHYYAAPAMRVHAVKNPDGTPIKIHYKFIDEKNNTSIGERDLTWMDVFSIAVNMFIHKSRGIITRYPITSKLSMVPAKLHPVTMGTDLGTLKLYKDKEALDSDDNFETIIDYPDLSVVKKKYNNIQISSMFIETVSFSNMYLSGLDGDYDGDKINLRVVYSEEAVKEIDSYMNSTLAHLNVDGSNSRTLGNESIQALWNLTTTKRAREGKLTIDINTYFDKDEYTMGEINDLLDKNHPETKVNYKGMETTFGRILFNKVVFSHIPNHEFVNTTLTKGEIGKLLNKYTSYLLDDSITWYDMEKHLLMLDKIHDLAFGSCDIIASTISYDMLIKDDKVFNKKRDEIMKDIAEIKKNNDGVKYHEKEEELINFMKEHYKDHQLADMYDSGAKPRWDNDIKTIKVGLGIVPRPGTAEYTLITNPLKEGIKNEDIKPSTDLQIYGAYNRASLTEKAGYTAKRLNNTFQSLTLYSGDCGSKQYLKVKENNPVDLLYRYAKGSKEDILITPSNVNQYVGKEVELRSPIYCKHKKGYCTKCSGETIQRMYRRDGYKEDHYNVGLYLSDIGNDILNKFMKKTHDLRQKLYEIKDIHEFLE